MIHLRVIKGSKIIRNDDGSLANENQIVKLRHGTLEWKNYMKSMVMNGFFQAHVEKAVEMSGKYDDKGQSIGEEVDIKEYEAEVQAIISPTTVKTLSLEDQLAEMKVQMKELQKGNVKPLAKNGLAIEKEEGEKSHDNTPNVNEELETAYNLHEKLFGKQPHHASKLAGVNEKNRVELERLEGLK